MIILIDNYDSFTFNLYQIVASITDTRVFRNDKISINEIERLNPEGIIISPGPGRPEQAGICLELIRKLAHKLPILGICLGHQAIAKSFGGNVIQHNEIIHGKKSLIHHLESRLFKHFPSSFEAARYHSLIVDLHTLPAELKITAICNNGSIMAIEHQIFPCFGIQFHPESALTKNGEELINNFLNICNKGKKHVSAIHQQAHAA